MAGSSASSVATPRLDPQEEGAARLLRPGCRGPGPSGCRPAGPLSRPARSAGSGTRRRGRCGRWDYPGPVFNQRMNERMAELEREYDVVLAELNDPSCPRTRPSAFRLPPSPRARGAGTELASSAGRRVRPRGGPGDGSGLGGRRTGAGPGRGGSGRSRHRPAGGGAAPAAGAAGSQRRPQRDHGDPGCRGRRGGQPLRQGPLRDVRPLRRRAGLEDRGPVVQPVRAGRAQRDHLRGEG